LNWKKKDKICSPPKLKNLYTEKLAFIENYIEVAIKLF